MIKIVDHMVHNHVNEHNQVFEIEHLEDLDLIEVELTKEIELEPPRLRRRRYESLELTSDNLKTHLISIEETPNLELKQLLPYLKYVYLGKKDTLAVIISSLLDSTQKKLLMYMLRKHHIAISWHMPYTKGISSSIDKC